jgi:hypothetical protein
MTKKLAIFIDNCAWDVLYKHRLSLSKELPRNEFDLFVTKEVGAFEVPTIPDEKRAYVEQQMAEAGVQIHSFFGFTSYNNPPGYRDRVGGFGEGRWASVEELQLLQRFKMAPGKERKTGLYKHEADASLAVRACAGDIVLTAEKPDNGPLKEAFDESGRVVSLLTFDPSKETLKEFILASIKRGVT